MIGFRSLRVRMIVFLVALLGAVQVAEFVLTNHASYNAARGKIEDELGVGQKVFARVLRQNAEREAQAASASASDFAFREAVATGDVATLASALENQRLRIKAQAVLYVDLNGDAIVDTMRPGASPRRFELGQLIMQARADGEATAIGMLDASTTVASKIVVSMPARSRNCSPAQQRKQALNRIFIWLFLDWQLPPALL